MKRPLVTVLMALYNGGEYLKETIESVLRQTYDHFEFLIINDCSTDDSLKTIESFGDKRIRVYNNEKNLGQTPSLNRGVKLAKGDYFARIDGDDLALPQWLETQVKAAEQYPDYSVISSYALGIDQSGRIKKVYTPPIEKEDIILRSLITPPIHHVGSILKKKDIVGVGGYDDRLIYTADYDLWERLVRKNYKITTTPKVLVAFREHGNSVSRSEHGRRDLEEIKEIAGRNVRSFVEGSFTEKEISLFCRANYDEGGLSATEFDEAVKVTKNVYMNLIPSIAIEHRKISKWTQARCTTIYLKRIFHYIQRKDYSAVREFSKKGMKDFGLLTIFTPLWVASLTGGVCLDFIPKLYLKMIKQKAHWGLGFQSQIKNT